MTDIVDIIETLIGAPVEPFQYIAIYLGALVLLLFLFFMLFDLLYAMATGWWRG